MRVARPVSAVKRLKVKGALSQTRGLPTQNPGETLYDLQYHRSERKNPFPGLHLIMLEIRERVLETPRKATKIPSRLYRHLL
jgi:hypothetical protein